jgi:dCMP deaminase|tara:strand:+ start:46 stop:456 length:411 start_codon:yes stop_codon:yes gene_type:complete
MKERPTWDEYFKEITYTTAKRSSCEKLNVGCLFIKDNRIIAQGYNGYISGCQHKSIIKDGHNIATIHAEQNTITDCAKRGVSCYNSTAYITHYPCFNCMKLMVSSGINSIKYMEDYKNDPLVKELALEASIEIIKI